MSSTKYKVVYPDHDNGLDQNEEFFKLVTESGEQRLRIHDYDKVYQVPGLYEEVVYDRLKCDSPDTVCSLLAQEINDLVEEIRALGPLNWSGVIEANGSGSAVSENAALEEVTA